VLEWDAERLAERLRTELAPRAWKRLSSAASRAGMDIEALLPALRGGAMTSTPDDTPQNDSRAREDPQAE
jgi:hypothetical protein